MESKTQPLQPDEILTDVCATDRILQSNAQARLVERQDSAPLDFPECIHYLIERQAEQSPQNVAVICGNQSITYQELNRKANQLAHRLISLGIGPDRLVGLCVERSLAMAIGILGILKAGGAYLPLDPAYPQARLEFMVEDAQVAVLVTQKGLNQFQVNPEVPRIYVDADWSEIAQEPETNPTTTVTPNHLVYVIYTSGSTGQPKGVMVTHQNLAYSTLARFIYYKEPVGRFLPLSSFAFDSSVPGIFWTLCQGGTLVLPPENFQQELLHVIALIANHCISHLNCLPSLYQLILEYAEPQQLSSLKTIIVGGETCPVNLVKHHHQILPSANLFNEYGPTEGTVWSTVYHCQFPDLTSQVPIGRPIANVKIYILDEQLNPVPTGESGEIYIGGAGVASGYLNRPELTAERFIANPFRDQAEEELEPGSETDWTDLSSSSLLYKTGDLARYLPDGNIEFLGRIDHQVKIRGFRIELQELESVLMTHPLVKQAVVLARDDQSGKRLVAYIVLYSGESLGITELRRYLQEKLPEYAIPAAFVMLEAMPQTPNGKVDRRALPAPLPQRPELAQAYVAPRNHQESILEKIFAIVLGLDHVGIHDNFFELGGDSFRSLQIVLKLQQEFSIEFPVVKLFQHPTIVELTQKILEIQEGQNLDSASISQDIPTSSRITTTLSIPPKPGARLGRDPKGFPAWYISDAANPGKFLQIQSV